MSILNFFALFPLSVATIAIAYRFLKFPKQDVTLLRQLLFRNNRPIILGHRGGNFEAPENTCLAIETAAKNGATAVEIDLEFSKDEIPVIFHDDEVDRMTNGTGKVSDILYDDLKLLNAAAKHDYTITKGKKENVSFEKIPTLMEAVETCMKYNLIIDLDLKSNARKSAETLKSLLEKYPTAPRFIFVTSFHPYIIYHIRKACPEYLTGLIWRYHFLSRTLSGDPRYAWYLTPFLDMLDKIHEVLIHSWLPDFLGLSLVVMKKDHLSKRYIDEWRRKDIELVTWTVNNVQEKEFLLKNLRVPIITDTLLNSEDCAEQTV